MSELIGHLFEDLYFRLSEYVSKLELNSKFSAPYYITFLDDREMNNKRQSNKTMAHAIQREKSQQPAKWDNEKEKYYEESHL